MKRIILLIIMTLLIGAATASIFGAGTEMLNELNGFLLALGVVIGTAIGIWVQIRANLKKEEIKKALVTQTTELIGEAKDNSISLLSSLVNKPAVDLILNPKESKNLIVATALKEREPKKTKKLGLNDILSIGNFVSDVYSQVKPLVRKIGK